ncbi:MULTISPECIES: polysaccharide biosynthesis C-terminal domain-containing protein [unclassified Breznakia]|uniref:oligosaccharide flippase family protein n=1 Tax=unclassified Breznakia TaxID=2623764 RepID=UPI002474FF64|nr:MULTISPECIES: polysaccharide biosynthesis C-terminal domain-containing protein [unclassified Breznakia]MDH6366325.1 O-antigen/teichoic acid export membrane protein [Breznakia sp. PH1-1]MDH6403418.1 O-antigen/teichoic acid export membrane protein [Breznakia sp. PF1-11]MDH6411127.1 O-antigen/teichoic acid export membrane protein [Breznakia sp. PFB1-11]MDH6413610.1 O-antigen/teichoic acid export membrane protein [Breznakia sp. PFB1-14]MDH6415672.1 O-antigen/teichoic acid export membrane protei
MKNNKKSLLVGGLVSSAGLFIAKFLSIFYTIPFDAILKSAEYKAVYGGAYGVYSYVLTIAQAGLPFAIATLVSRYMARDDYKTTLLVRKVSFYTMTAFGFICMLFLLVASGPLASQMASKPALVPLYRNSLVILSLAVFIIPILSSVRGFYQGLKEIHVYSASQIVEQIVRILFLLIVSGIAIYVLDFGRYWAVYFGVIATSVSGVVTIAYIKRNDSKTIKPVVELANQQEKEPVDAKIIFRELIILAIPFLINAAFGYCDQFLNIIDFKPGLEAFGRQSGTLINASIIDMYQDAVLYKAMKLIAIPMVLAPGFSSAIYPYITEARERNQPKVVSKYVVECVESVVYICLPICVALALFARPILYTLYGVSGEYSELYVNTLQWFTIEGISATICPIFASLVIALGRRKQIIYTTMVFGVTKFLTNRLFISMFGVPGMVLSSLLAYIIFAGLNIYIIQKECQVNWKYSFRKLIFILTGLVGMFLVSMVFNWTGLLNYSGNRVVSLLLLGFMGILTVGVYAAITLYCNIPQSIFHFDLDGIKNKFRRGK